jgi:hypothetical protein
VIDRNSIGLVPPAARAGTAGIRLSKKGITDYFTGAAAGFGTIRPRVPQRPAQARTALPAGMPRQGARIVTPEFSSHYIKYQCRLIALYR